MSGVMYPTMAPAADVQTGSRQRTRSPAVLCPQHPFRSPRLPLSSTSGARPAPASGSPRTTRSTGVFASASCRCTRRPRAASWTGWLATPDGALALVLLLDQFPRNAFRGTPRMYATDALAREVTAAAIDAGHDRAVEPQMQLFFYLPFGHSEDLADQERSVALARRLGQPILSHAEGHRDIIRRFGRFPHRNPILGRTMRPEEQQFLDEGGYAG